MKEVEIHLSGGQKISFKAEEVDIRTATETNEEDDSVKIGDVVGYNFKPAAGTKLEVVYFRPRDIIGALVWDA